MVLGILLSSTGHGAALGLSVFASRELAGIAAGLGVPAVFVGVFAVLPASGRERVAAGIGAAVAVFGVLLFAYAYPERWVASGPGHLALPAVVVYFLGAITCFFALFTAVVSFKTRNDPGGTVTLERTINGRTRRVEVPVSELEGKDVSGLGGVGILGDVDREAVVTGDDAVVERSGADEPARESSASPSSSAASPSSPASDGGTAGGRLRTPGGESGPGGRPDGTSTPTDQYCGNCHHYDYVRTDDGIQPYCGYYDRPMDDMEPCDHWVRTAGH